MQQQCRRSGKRKHRMKLTLPPKLVEKLVWVPVISFCKIFIPSDSFHGLLCRNWPFSPRHRLTLLITIMCQFFGPAVSSTLCKGCPDFCLQLAFTRLCMYYDLYLCTKDNFRAPRIKVIRKVILGFILTFVLTVPSIRPF